MKILLLEDDTVLSDILIDFLQESYEVNHVYSVAQVIASLDEKKYDLYIFDVNVNDGDGITLLKELRTFHDQTPTIIITAFHDMQYLKSGFEAGANDFIKKPFDLEELKQRIENIKRHFGLSNFINLGQETVFDTQAHVIKSKEHSVVLSAKHSACLHYLYQNRHRIVSAEELLQKFWEYDEMPSENAIRTIVKELRKVIGRERIVNVRGEGYRFE